MNEKSGGKLQGKAIAAFLFFLFVFLIAFVIRFNYLKKPSFWSDEMCQIWCTRGSFSNIWKKCPQDKPPLDYYIQWFFLRNGLDEIWARLHACILGSATVLVLCLWARSIGGWVLCLIMLSLVLANPLLVHYSTEGRPYALMLFSICIFVANLSGIVNAQKPVSFFRWASLSLCIFLCLWSLYFAWAFVILTLLFTCILILIQKRGYSLFSKKRDLFIAVFFIVLPFLVSLPLVSRALAASREEFIVSYSNVKTFDYLDMLVLGYNWMRYVQGAGWMWFFLGLIGFVGWMFRLGNRWYALFCGFMFSVFFFGIFCFYKLIDHWMSVRYLLVSLPFMAILVAMGIANIGILVSQLAGKISSVWKVYFKSFSIALLCLGYLVPSLWFISKIEYPRPNWREFARRIKSLVTDKTVVIVDDLLVFRHYAALYSIPARISRCNFTSQSMKDILDDNKDVWVALAVYNITPDTRKELSGLYREFPEFPLLDVRRSRFHLVFEDRKKTLLDHALSFRNPVIRIVMGENDESFLGIGFDRLERWNEQSVRAVDGSRGECFLSLDRPFPLFVSLSFYPYRPDDPPSLTLALKINGNIISEKVVTSGWNFISWEVDRKCVHQGINRIEIIPNRTLQPAQMEEGSEDTRNLSIWVERILLGIREGEWDYPESQNPSAGFQ